MIITPTLEVQGDLSSLAVALRALRPGCRSRVVGHLAEGDYTLDVSLGATEARISMRATLRDRAESGGTWWTTRELVARPAPRADLREAVAGVVTAAVSRLRGDFTRLLKESEAVARPG